MSNKKKEKEPSGCGCANIPISLIIILLGCGYGLFTQRDKIDVYQFFPQLQEISLPAFLNFNSTPVVDSSPISSPSPKKIPNQENEDVNNTKVAVSNPTTSPTPAITPEQKNQEPVKKENITNPVITPPEKDQETPQHKTTNNKYKISAKNWNQKAIRGIYLTRYLATNRASEKMIRERVRYYKSQGFNTLIHGVWGNGCSMYNSQVMRETLGYKSCPNEFRDRWLDWLIDEAHKQDMEVHAYFERGIKIDKTSPIYNLAVTRKWLVPGVDKTYVGLEQYILDVGNPEVANFLTKTMVEFVQRYPKIDAVQWDDYLAYYAELPGNEDRTPKLTKFTQGMITAMKKANPNVSFDVCHHNPYWAKRYFAADWKNWNVDRAFIQAYNDKNFADELNYAKQYQGIAISEKQFHRLQQVVNNPKIESILIFPLNGKPIETAADIKKSLTED